MNHNRILRVLSMLGGLGLVSVVAWANASRVARQSPEGYLSSDVWTVIALAYGSALAAVIVTALWVEGRKITAAVLVLLVMAGEGYGFYLTFERIVEARDARALAAVSSNELRLIAMEKVKRATAEVAQASMMATSARSDKRCDSACQSREVNAEKDARARLEAAEIELSKAPPIAKARPVVEAIGESAGYRAELGSALAAPLALLGLGLVLIAWGCGSSSDKREPDTAPVPGARPDRESALAWIQEETRRNGGVPPRFHVVKNQLGLPKATAHRYLTEVRKASGE